MAVMMAGEEHDIGFKLYLRAASKLEKFVNSFEEHFTWLQEILAEAKNTFSNSEIQLLPKTPSVIKRKQRRPKNVIVEEEDEPRRKSSRRVKRSKKSMEDCESSSTNQGATSVVPTSARVTRSSRSTRSTRNNPLPVSSKAGGSGSPQPNIPKSSLFSADKNKSKTAASSPNQQITKPSPKAIPGFTTLSVKDKASAYEEYVTQSPGGVAVNVPSDDSASPRRRNAVCKVLDRLRQSNSPRRSKSPLSGSKTTGNVHPSDRSTITKSQAVEGSPKPGPQTLKGNEQSKARRSSTRVVSMPLGVRKLSKRRSSMLRQKVSLAASTKNSSSIRRTPSKCRKPTPAPTTFVGTTEDEQTDCSDKTEEKLPSTDPGCETEDQPEPMQVQDVSDTTAVSDSSGSSRATRSKVPESKAPPQPLLGTDEEATAKKGSATEDGGSQGDAEDECDSPCPKAPVPAPRTTRSKLRLNKPALKLPVTSSDEEGSPARQASSFRPVAPPSTLAPCRSTRSKVRQWKNHEVESPSYTHLKRVRDASKVDEASPPKKRCTDVCGVGENNEEGSGTPVSEDTEGAVDKTPSPKCPRNKIIHGGSNPSQSFANNLKKTVNTPGNLCSTLTSFIKRHTPKKGTVQINMERDLQKRKELDAKNKEMESRLNKRQELLQQRAEDQRRRRIERQELVAKRRQEQQQREMSVKKETLQKFVEKKDLQTRIHEEKQREEREKQKLREKKMMEAELRRKQEIEARQQKLLEAEAEARKQEEFQQRKREFEEAERQRRIAEHRRLEEERRIEAEQERQREIKKLKREQEQRERDLAGQKRLKEETLKRERAERERLAREAQEERERQRMEELDRIRERERERLQALYASKKEEEKKSKEEERKLHEAIHKHNQALHSNTSILNSTTKLKENLNSTITKETPSLNTTITKETPSLKTTITKETSTVNTESYNMTPTQKKKKVRNHNNENYDISEMNSEDSTDDDEAPRKVVPKWALGANLKAALIHQYYHPPNLDEIFDTIEYSDLDLNVVFKTKRPRFNKRTSSACWDSPILKPSGAMP